MRLTHGKTRHQFKELLDELTRQNKLPDSGIRVTLTGGCSADGFTLSTPNLIITQRPLVTDDHGLAGGIKLVSYEYQRQIPDVKTIDYLMAIWLKPYVVQNNADDLLYHKGGSITESPRSNFFIVTENEKLVTPRDNILKGINRKYVIQIAKENFDVEERDIMLDEAYNAKEVFLTSTTKLVLPVVALDGRKIGRGEAGSSTLKIKAGLQALIQER